MPSNEGQVPGPENRGLSTRPGSSTDTSALIDYRQLWVLVWPGIFSVTTRLATALGLAVTSEIADSVSKAYNNKHPDLDAQSPEVLMVGFRAAGWTCFASTLLGIVIVIFGLRGLGIIGKKTHATEDAVQSDDDTLKSHQIDPESFNEKGT